MVLVFSVLTHAARAQATFAYSTAQAHSHNDNRQIKPFTEACEQQFGSIETDLMLVKEILYAVNHREDATPNRTFEKLYIEPILARIEKNGGQIYPEKNVPLQFLIDIKTDAVTSLDALVKSLEKYPTLTAPETGLVIVVGGNIPEPAQFGKYPSFITFDGNPEVSYTPDQLKRIALMSQSFGKYTNWNGEGPLPRNDKKTLTQVIQKTHNLGKKIRFYDTPDNIHTWKIMMALQVDYLDTGNVIKMGDYLRTAPR